MNEDWETQKQEMLDESSKQNAELLSLMSGGARKEFVKDKPKLKEDYQKHCGDEALNYNENKPIGPALILVDMPLAWEEFLKARTYGAEKYDRLNWAQSKGKASSVKFLADNTCSFLRHVGHILVGRMWDTEDGTKDGAVTPENKCSGCMHAALIMVRMAILIEYVLHKEPKKTRPVEINNMKNFDEECDKMIASTRTEMRMSGDFPEVAGQ